MPHEIVDGDVHEVGAAVGANTVETVFETPDDAGFRMTHLELEYAAAATVATVVEIHDAPDGTASGDLDADTRRYETELSPDDRVALGDWPFRDVEEDILVLVDGNQNGDYHVTVGGTLLDGPAA